MRYLLMVLGFLFTALGILGIVLPILPTTPFLLLAAACFSRSSKRFHHWLLNNRFLGSYIKNYKEKRGITCKHKVITLVFMWVVIILSVIYATSLPWLRVLLLFIAAGVTYHLGTLKTLKQNERNG